MKQELKKCEDLESRFGNNTTRCRTILVVAILQNSQYGTITHYLEAASNFQF